MRTLIHWLKTPRAGHNGERGAALTEYGILLTLIAAVVVGVITSLGSEIRDVVQRIVDQI